MKIIFILILLFVLFLFYFYRLPQQTKLKNNFNTVYSPAYGKVMDIKFEEDYIYVAIFLSPFDVHYQFAPISGKITEIKYDPTGQFNLAYELNKSNQNEKMIYQLENKRGKFIIYLIAGFLVRRISNLTLLNNNVNTGDTIGLIHFGSRVDIKIPKNNFNLKVKVNDKVYGSNTILGFYEN